MTTIAERSPAAPVEQESFSYDFGKTTPHLGYPALGSPDNFTRTKTESGQAYFEHPFVDVRALIEEASKGPVVEIGGPSGHGYMCLEGVRLGSKPIITNIAGSEKFSEAGKPEELTDFDRKSIDIMADSRHIPFADKSLGVVLASFLPKSDVYNPMLRFFDLKDLNGILKHAAHRIAQGKDASYEAELSPRVGFWLETERVLKEGGVVVYAGATKADVAIASSLGFSMVAHSPLDFGQYFDEKRPHLTSTPQEIVFEKTGKVPKTKLEPTVRQIAQAAVRAAIYAKFPDSD